jgi:geranylgeranyl pyrophosphate synthase
LKKKTTGWKILKQNSENKLELNQIYEPINTDLTKVEEALQTFSRVDFPWLSQLLNHSLTAGGKRIRPALTLLAGKFYNYRLDYLTHMALSIELMHTATLIHDDAIDKSDTRRGRTTIYKLWGVEPAVLLGDYLFAKAGIAVSDTQNITCIKLFSQTLSIISRGELNQAKNAFNLNQTREQYFDRIYSKTASLFSLATETGGILSEAPEKAVSILREYGRDAGIAFQIVDDILDFIGTEQELGKPAGSDLRQGTFTLPSMLLNMHYPQDNPVKRLFQNKKDEDNILLAIEQVRNSSIVEECYQVATEFCNNACRRLTDLPDTPSRRSLKELADFVIRRKK